MRKCLNIIVLSLLILIVTSCAAAPNGDHNSPNDEMAGVVDYYHYHNIYINDIQYALYLPSDNKSAVRYYYTESSNVSTLETWTINMEYTVKYLYSQELIMEESFYSLLSDLSILIQKDFPNAQFVRDGIKEEIEFTLLNPEKEQINYVLIEYYFPVKLVERTSGNDYYVFIPIYKDILIKKESTIQNINKDEYITLETFYSNESIYPKR